MPSPSESPFAHIDFLDFQTSLESHCIAFSPRQGGQCQDHSACLLAGIQQLETKLTNTLEGSDRAALHRRLAYDYLSQEDPTKVAYHATQAYRLAPPSDTSLGTSSQLQKKALLEPLLNAAAAHMRAGEATNCLDNHNEYSCIFPLAPEAWHRDKRGSKKALEMYREYLERMPESMEVRWLVNVTHMTLGTYPDGVDKRYLIPPAVFESPIPFKRFRNIAPELGFHVPQMAGAAVADDFNNDGHLDIILSSMWDCDPVLYYQSDGNGKFTDRSAESNLSTQLGTPHIIQVDYDNDGNLDLYLPRAPWDNLSTAANNSLLRNTGDATFEDVSEKVGLGATPNNNNIASVWGDFDNDGWVDLFVCNETREPDLFRNNRGTFVNTIAESGITNASRCKGAAWGDVNNDGWIDLFLANWNGANKLYINQKDGSFKQDRQNTLEERPVEAFATWFWDYNNDGWLDLFVGGFMFQHGIHSYASELVGHPFRGDSHRVFMNKGDGQFTDVTRQLGLDVTRLTMGANYGDLDNDGYPDFYLGTGSSQLWEIHPNAMFKNIGGQKFVDVTSAGGFGNLQKGHGIAFADFDNDGDQDVLAQLGGSFPVDRYFPNFFENPGFGNNWITLRLRGVRANRAAIGSRVRAVLIEDGKKREVHKLVGTGGSFGSNSLQVEIGLGKAKTVDLLEITWAGSLHVDRFENVEINQIVSVTEGEPSYVVVRQPEFSFQAASSSSHQHHHSP